MSSEQGIRRGVPTRVPARSALRGLFAAAVAAGLLASGRVAPARAQDLPPVDGEHIVAFRPGMGGENGLVLASIHIEYSFFVCRGDLYVSARLKPETYSAHGGYVLDGVHYNLPPHIRPPPPARITYTGYFWTHSDLSPTIKLPEGRWGAFQLPITGGDRLGCAGNRASIAPIRVLAGGAGTDEQIRTLYSALRIMDTTGYGPHRSQEVEDWIRANLVVSGRPGPAESEGSNAARARDREMAERERRLAEAERALAARKAELERAAARSRAEALLEQRQTGRVGGLPRPAGETRWRRPRGGASVALEYRVLTREASGGATYYQLEFRVNDRDKSCMSIDGPVSCLCTTCDGYFASVAWHHPNGEQNAERYYFIPKDAPMATYVLPQPHPFGDANDTSDSPTVCTVEYYRTVARATSHACNVNQAQARARAVTLLPTAR